MNSNELLIGCGIGFTSFDEYGKGTGEKRDHKFYSIISIKEESVVQTGEMSRHRSWYGLVKMKNMYYAIAGCRNTTIDIYNSETEQWELMPYFYYGLEYCSAVEF